MLTSEEINDFLDCFELDQFVGKVLRVAVDADVDWLVDTVVEAVLSSDMSVFRDMRLKKALDYLYAFKGLPSPQFDEDRLALAIKKVEYCMGYTC